MRVLETWEQGIEELTQFFGQDVSEVWAVYGELSLESKQMLTLFGQGVYRLSRDLTEEPATEQAFLLDWLGTSLKDICCYFNWPYNYTRRNVERFLDGKRTALSGNTRKASA